MLAPAYHDIFGILGNSRNSLSSREITVKLSCVQLAQVTVAAMGRRQGIVTVLLADDLTHDIWLVIIFLRYFAGVL